MKTLGLLIALLATGVAGARDNPAATVHIKNFAFDPLTVTVTAGDSVAFVNDDDEAHTVTATGGAFDSKAIDTHGRWEYTFQTAGTFGYICAVHPSMKGTIVVKPAAQ